jgi:5'-deoxynucleotidase YfbR-like HD superfamily hydrolase
MIEHIKHLVDAKMIDQIVKGMSLEQLVAGIRSPNYPDRLGYYQFVNKGSIFFPCDPRPEEVHIEDIAQGLSRIHRFNGQTKREYTVAEHTWIVSQMVEGSPTKKLCALLHDAPEAYINDMIRSLKYLPIMGTIYLKIEDGIEEAIGQKFGLPTPFLSDPDIKQADEVIVGVEMRETIASQQTNHLTPITREDVKDNPIKLFHWSSELAQKMWLARFWELQALREKAAA